MKKMENWVNKKMKYGFSILVASVLLSACTPRQSVDVVKATDTSTIAPQPVTKQVELPANLPTNVTAICRDGSYSTASSNACSGNGGVATAISRYSAE